jgi:hypothetical protein
MNEGRALQLTPPMMRPAGQELEVVAFASNFARRKKVAEDLARI